MNYILHSKKPPTNLAKDIKGNVSLRIAHKIRVLPVLLLYFSPRDGKVTSTALARSLFLMQLTSSTNTITWMWILNKLCNSSHKRIFWRQQFNMSRAPVKYVFPTTAEYFISHVVRANGDDEEFLVRIMS